MKLVQYVQHPTLHPYLPDPELATGAAVIICPGGGYRVLAIDHEGHKFAQWFADRGVAAFVLKYRLPTDYWMKQPEKGPLMDLQRALQVVRERSAEWSINAERVGVMGFSAGGHLAATALTHEPVIEGDEEQRFTVKPNFGILIYPVISMGEAFGHVWSRRQLLGDWPKYETVEAYSAEKQVDPETPPCFLLHAADDKVSVRNSLAFADALAQSGVSVEVHIPSTGGHGFGMAEEIAHLKGWPQWIWDWMNRMGWLE
ncbi:alpha/beta hydrolase [Pontibacter sp. G13]|uniref:alpha/beta hydrolase n=1 Tax=Pontibacter sp. G13 TaxID=3074898 RepID=UPI00288951D3|nr:alpha/beta hydrolase [Pontibacter sp. G13]WNJ20746.1 alpha/beta hydrolase [Pontibacter sp. G13]